MSFFDGVEDLDTIPDDPFGIPDNTYRVRIMEANYGPTRATEKDDIPKYGITVKYQIIDGEYQTAFPFQEWLHTPGKNDDPNDPDPKKKAEVRRSHSNLKKHFLAYGFGVDELRTIVPENGFETAGNVPMLVDREVYVKVKTKLDKQDRKQIQVQDLFSVDSEGADEFIAESSKNSIVDF